uniref:Uncharacterized protein n=1 Tax=Oncorhynchus mykiss TaxID=8022 RepID=A0A8C7LLC8_ONCMY
MPNNISISGRFWHISDLHFDPPYHVTDEYTKVCSPLRVSQPQTLVFLETSCVTLPAHPVSFQHMKQVAPQPEFMIWTRFVALYDMENNMWC